MPASSYDVIVLGSDLAGLVAATLCSSRGLRVLLAEEGQTRSHYQLGPYKLPLEPLLLSGLEAPSYARVFEELHFQHLLKRKLETLSPPCQLLGPNFRIDCDVDSERFAGELARELESNGEWLAGCSALSSQLDEAFTSGLSMPAAGFFERRELAKITHKTTQKARKWLEACPDGTDDLLTLPAALGTCGNVDSPLLLARFMSQVLRGVQRMEGGYGSLRSILLEKLTSHNGERREIWTDRLTTSWGKITGLRSIDGEEIAADCTLYAMPISELVPLFGGKVPKKLQELADKTRPVAYRYTLHLIVHSIGLPEGMGNVAFSVRSPSESPLDGNLLSISVRATEDAGRSVVSLQALAPARDDGSPALSGLRERVLDHVRWLMPFVDDHIEHVHSPNETTRDDELACDLKEPHPPTAIWQTVVDDVLEQQSLPFSIGAKQLLIANCQTLPDLGIEGQFIAGWSAAKAATAAVGKRSKGAERKELVSSDPP